MQSALKTAGIHHITAVASSAQENLSFYRDVLGLRLVKKTVNFDDPYTYHLYYGDDMGSPGTILTFFPWENLPQGRPGAGMVTAVAFAVPTDALKWWQQYLAGKGIDAVRHRRFGESLLHFNDPHGLPLELVAEAGTLPSHEAPTGPVPRSHAIVGFHSATTVVHSLAPIHELLVDVMGMELLTSEDSRHRYGMPGDGQPGICYDVVEDRTQAEGRPGGGTVHHIAFRAIDEREQRQWQQWLQQKGHAVTPVRDRNYFRSIYFPTPGGPLFEIATDPPGFTVDEPVTQLGRLLKLPVKYERRRREIEARLPQLVPAAFRHTFRNAAHSADAGCTVVALHGTGGSEHHMADLAAGVMPNAAVLSPRGKVLENGMPRFFRRLANNVLDEADVVRRAHQLADFLVDAAVDHGRDPERLVALGYSNGANIAAAIMLLRPELFSQAVLLRPMLPLQQPSLPDLSGKRILIITGRRDTVIPAASTAALVDRLQESGASLTLLNMAAGHEVTADDLKAAGQWLAEQLTIAVPPSVGEPQPLTIST